MYFSAACQPLQWRIWPILIPAFLFGGLNFFVFINQYSFITFVLEAEPYTLSPQFLGMLFLTYLSGTWGSTLSGKFSRRFGQANCMMVGSGLLMIGSLVTLSAECLRLFLRPLQRQRLGQPYGSTRQSQRQFTLSGVLLSRCQHRWLVP